MDYFSGNPDDWDPLVTDGFATGYDVILFNNAGVSSSGGETPGTVSEMTRHAVAFCDALKQLVSKLGKGARAVTMDEAAKAPIVLLAVPWPKVEAVLGKLPDWEGRIPIAERYSPSRIADAVAHVGQADRAGVVLIDFSKD